MLKRTIYIGNPSYVKYKLKQLLIYSSEDKELKGSVPIEDLGFLVLDHPQITITTPLLVYLQQKNVAIVCCDEKHLPLGLMLPLYGHVEHSFRLQRQVEMSEPLRKQLWKQTVQAKIGQQGLLLKKLHLNYGPMSNYQEAVKSGDTTNMEGIAAQFYWRELFGNFIREREGEYPNAFLNFGYAILRSMVARALVCVGLNPSLGIFHSNKYNPYCLADDLMEPYRPYVDWIVLSIMKKYKEINELTKPIKAELLQIATLDVSIMGKMRPLLVALSSTASSFYKCVIGEYRLLNYPTFI